MKIGDNIKVKIGATEWMKNHNFWCDILPENIDDMDGKIIDDYTCLNGDSKHYGIEFNDIEIMVGIHPQWLTLL
jgi:hypothetical protein